MEMIINIGTLVIDEKEKPFTLKIAKQLPIKDYVGFRDDFEREHGSAHPVIAKVQAKVLQRDDSGWLLLAITDTGLQWERPSSFVDEVDKIPHLILM
jgi:hypothetical protein